MKSLTILLTGLLVAAFSARADVLIYKNKITGTQTGGGVSVKYTGAGYTIIDTDDVESPVSIVAFTKLKTFSEVSFDCVFDPVSAPGKKGVLQTMYVISEAYTWISDDGYEYATSSTLKGTATLFSAATLGTTNAWNVPKTMTYFGRYTYPNENVESIFEEASGTLTLDTTWTKTCNTFGDDSEAAISRLRSYLISQGYTER